MSKGRVYSSLKLAKDNLKEYATEIGKACCVYEVHYGANMEKREYVIKQIVDEVLDIESNRIKSVFMPNVTKKIEKRIPKKIDYPTHVILNPTPLTTNLFYEICVS